MTDFEVYQLFSSLNNHFFVESYDYFRYAGQVSTKPETYNKKKQGEKYHYQKLAKKYTKDQLENLIVSNLITTDKRLWIGSLSDKLYEEWLKRTESIQYNFLSELSELIHTHNFNDLFKCENNQHPIILKEYLKGTLSIETFILMNLCVGFFKVFVEKLADDPIWLSVYRKCLKYQPFIQKLNTDVSKLKKDLYERLN